MNEEILSILAIFEIYYITTQIDYKNFIYILLQKKNSKYLLLSFFI